MAALVAGVILVLAHVFSSCAQGQGLGRADNVLSHQRQDDHTTVQQALSCMQPSTFDLRQETLTARLVVLLNEEHEKFWDQTLEVLKTIVPEDQLPSTEGRIKGFRNGYGSVSF